MNASLKEFLLYRYRYIIGGALLIVLSLYLVLWQLADIPPGFSDAEKQAALESSQLAFAAGSFVNLPYHLLQQASMWLSGPSAWGIRLPSALLGLGMLVAMYFLLRKWFRDNIAVIGTLITATSVYFLLQARLGTPEILYFLWPVLLLLTASYAGFSETRWRPWLWAFTAVAGLALYTPYMAYLIAILVLVAAVSRTGRALMSEIDGPAISLSGLTLAVLLIPAVYGVYRNPEILLTYLGAAQDPSLALAGERLSALAGYLTGFGMEEGAFYPVLSLPAIALALYGLYRAVRGIGRASHAVMLLWLFTGVALFITLPEAPGSILFVPVILLVIIGFRGFMDAWYGLFPRNPYARTAALLPIALLLLVLVGFNYYRYFYGLPRAENVRAVYDSDMMLLQQRLGQRRLRINRLTVIVTPEQLAFFDLLQTENSLIRVTTPSAAGVHYSSGNIIIAEAAYEQLPKTTTQTLRNRQVLLLVDDRPSDNALRFRVYQ